MNVILKVRIKFARPVKEMANENDQISHRSAVQRAANESLPVT